MLQPLSPVFCPLSPAQDYIRTSTYQSAMLQNTKDFSGKVCEAGQSMRSEVVTMVISPPPLQVVVDVGAGSGGSLVVLSEM